LPAMVIAGGELNVHWFTILLCEQKPKKQLE